MIPSLLQKLTYSNIYQEMNVLLHFDIFNSVQLNWCVMLWNAFFIIPSLLQKLICSNIHQDINVFLHFGIFYSVLLKRLAML